MLGMGCPTRLFALSIHAEREGPQADSDRASTILILETCPILGHTGFSGLSQTYQTNKSENHLAGGHWHGGVLTTQAEQVVL
jgi:hypothetical protein